MKDVSMWAARNAEHQAFSRQRQLFRVNKSEYLEGNAFYVYLVRCYLMLMFKPVCIHVWVCEGLAILPKRIHNQL